MVVRLESKSALVQEAGMLAMMLMMTRFEIAQTRVFVELVGRRTEGKLVAVDDSRGSGKAGAQPARAGQRYKLLGLGEHQNKSWVGGGVLEARAGKAVWLDLPQWAITLRLARTGSAAAAKPRICQPPLLAMHGKLKCEPFTPPKWPKPGSKKQPTGP